MRGRPGDAAGEDDPAEPRVGEAHRAVHAVNRERGVRVEELVARRRGASRRRACNRAGESNSASMRLGFFARGLLSPAGRSFLYSSWAISLSRHGDGVAGRLGVVLSWSCPCACACP